MSKDIHELHNELSEKIKSYYAEIIKLAERAKSEGWAGDWDKRIENAKKKLG